MATNSSSPAHLPSFSGIPPNHLQDILDTFTEIIRSTTSNPSYIPTSTEYYALIITTIKSASNIDQTHLKSLLHLLTLLLPSINTSIFLSQSLTLIELLSHYLNELTDSKIQFYCLTILGHLLLLIETSEAVWKTHNMLKLLNIFLKMIDHSSEKLQRLCHNRLTSLLEKHKEANIKFIRNYVAEFCSTILQSCHRSNYKRSLAIVVFFEKSLPAFTSNDMISLFRSCLALQECEQPLLTSHVFRTVDSFFQYPFTSNDHSIQSILVDVYQILVNNPPSTPDMESIAFYCTSLASAVISIYRMNPHQFWQHSSPHPIVQVTSLLLSHCESEFAQIHCAVGVALKRIINFCLDTSASLTISELVNLIEMGSNTIRIEHPLGQFIETMRGILHLRYQHAWIFILDSIRTLFAHLPGRNGKILLGEMVNQVADIYHAISTGVMTASTGVDLSIRDTLGAILRSLTLEHFLALVPFRRPNQPLSSDLDTSRDWIINILHNNLKQMPCKLHDFQDYILSVAKDFNGIIRLSRSQIPSRPQLNDTQLSILRTRVIQLWSLFPAFCSSSFGAPIDIPTAFPPLIPVLDAVLKDPDYPEVLNSVVAGLTALAASVKEKYPERLSSNLPKDYEVLQLSGAPVFIPLLLSILEGLDVSIDSSKFQPAVKCISAWASVASASLVSKVSKRLIQLLLSSTNAESIDDVTASSWLAVILALIPYQSEQMIILLYRTIKPLLSVHESVSMQKRAYKVLSGLLTSHAECLFRLEPKLQILEQISESLLTCHVSARHIRLMCVEGLIQGIVKEEKASPSGTDQLSQACASVFCETLICLKDANKKSRDGALSLLKVIFTSLMPHQVLTHLYAGIVGETAAMRSASILGLTLLVKSTQMQLKKSSFSSHESDEESDKPLYGHAELQGEYDQLVESIGQLLPTVLLLLKEESVEETRAVLTFTKVCLNVLPLETLMQLLPGIIEAVLTDKLGSGDDGKLKAKFSAKIRSLVRKACQRVGEDIIRPLLPSDDTALLNYIQRQGRRTQSKKDRQKQPDGHDDSDDDSESESEVDDREAMAKSSRNGKKPTRVKAIRANDFIGEGLPSSLEDLLEDTKQTSKKDNVSSGHEGDDDEEYRIQLTKDGRVMLVPNEPKSTGVATKGPTEDMELEAEADKGVKNTFKNDESDKKTDSKKRLREPGEEYRSKKAGGDVWRKGMLEPHAYIPLDARLLTKKNEKNAISHIGVAVQNATKRRIKEEYGGAVGGSAKKVSTMLSRKQRKAQLKGKK